VTDIVGGGPFRLKPGEWTDDTSMALCIAESLLECNLIHPIRRKGMAAGFGKAMSSTGRCFDIGNTPPEMP
jgi:ADP-ribosyl-[dinitrogen reductase] hydrolase